MRPRTRFAARWIVLALVLGCVSPPPGLPPSWRIVPGEPEAEPLSKRVVLVADNQLHNLYADPVAIRRTLAADKLVRTSIRPVQLDLYGQGFLEYVVEEEGKTMPVIHIGDACDLSCTGEFARFCEIMGKAKKGWAMAPGNHDGYLFGNEHGDPEEDPWLAACRNAGAPMTKDAFVRLYIGALTLQEEPGCRALAARLGFDAAPGPGGAGGAGDETTSADLLALLEARAARVPDRGDWSLDAGGPGGGEAFLRAAAWRIDPAAPWRSFVAQQLDVTARRADRPSDAPVVRILLLDTSQYCRKPTLIPFLNANAGLTGEILSDQGDVVEAWIDSSKGPVVWVTMGHHPYDALSRSSRAWLDEIRERQGIPFHVSAHTHSGSYIVHGGSSRPSGAKSDGTWLELNLGSILDWPLEYRTLSFFWSDGAVGARMPRRFMKTAPMSERLFGTPDERVEWEAKPGDPDDYLRQDHFGGLSAENTEDLLRNALLAGFLRLLRFVPTATDRADPNDPFWPPGCGSDDDVRRLVEEALRSESLEEKTRLLLDLERFDRRRPKDREMDRRFRLSGALWASQYETARARRPLVDDAFVVFPKE